MHIVRTTVTGVVSFLKGLKEGHALITFSCVVTLSNSYLIASFFL